MRFLTERGQNVNGQPNIIYVSTDNGATWLPLHEFVDVRIIKSYTLFAANIWVLCASNPKRELYCSIRLVVRDTTARTIR